MTNLKVTITEVPDPLLPDNVIAVIDGTPIVAAGKSKQEVWKELITSLAITIAHNSGLDYKELTYELKDSPYQGSAGVWRKASNGKPKVKGIYITRRPTLEGANWIYADVTYNPKYGDTYIDQWENFGLEWLDDSAAAPAGDGWMSEKPEFKSECTFLTATRIFRSDKWNYSVWSIAKIEGDDGWYLGIVDGTGDEWGDIEDLTADMYLILPSPPNKSA